MPKNWMRSSWAACSKAAAACAIGIGMAQAGGLQSDTDAATTSAGYGMPADFSVLLWAPLLLITFACVGGLLWLIRADARQGRLASPQTARRRRFKLMPARRIAQLPLEAPLRSTPP